MNTKGKEHIDNNTEDSEGVDVSKIKNYDTSWNQVFEDAIDEFETINEILKEEKRVCGRIFPDEENIFKAFALTSLDNVKVVIIGQDPYHQLIKIDGKNVPRAQGLSFSVHKDDQIPSSLKNIFIEIHNTVPGFKTPTNGDLTYWCEQGVLLLNTCLTVNPNAAGSHGDIWLGFIDRVIKAITMVNKKCIYLLWGREAQKLEKNIGGKGIVLTAAHPSGLSANRGFFGCDHFNKVNEILTKNNETTINWNTTKPKIKINKYIAPKKTTYTEITISNTSIESDNRVTGTVVEDKKIKAIKFN